MKGLIAASALLVLAASAAHGSPVGSCATFSGTGAINFLRDDRNCSVFYECIGSTPTMVVCPNGLHFNAVLKVCDWPAASGCAVTTPSPGQSTVFTRATPSTGKPQLQNADADSEPSSTEAAAVHAIPVRPVEPRACPAIGGCPKYTGDDSLVIQLPHAFNCSRFCKCDHGKAVTFECPNGLLYNKAEGYCDWPYNVVCQPDRGFAANWFRTALPSESSDAEEPSRRRRSFGLSLH